MPKSKSHTRSGPASVQPPLVPARRRRRDAPLRLAGPVMAADQMSLEWGSYVHTPAWRPDGHWQVAPQTASSGKIQVLGRLLAPKPRVRRTVRGVSAGSASPAVVL
jgi:hypothetical protein